MTDPNLPLAAEMPWQVHRYRVGKASAGIFCDALALTVKYSRGVPKLTMKVVVLGPVGDKLVGL